MRKRGSVPLSNCCLHSSTLALLAALATACSDDTTAPTVDSTSDAALATPDAAASSSATDLFGGNPPPAPTLATTSSAPDYDGTQVAAPIQACEDAVGGDGTPMIDDFEDGNTATIDDDGRGATWYFYDDMTQGERDDAVDVDPLGARSGKVLYVTGNGFTDWGSGFGAGMRWNTGQCTYDASAYDGVEFWIRGTGSTRVTLQNLSVRPVDLGGECPTDAACFDSHGVNLTLNDAWTLVHLPFSAFEQTGWGTPVGPLRTNAIYLLEFQFGTIKPYSVWLDDVKFFRNTDATDAGSSSVSVGSSATDESSSVVTNPTDDIATSAGTASSHTLQASSEGASSSDAQSAGTDSTLDGGTSTALDASAIVPLDTDAETVSAPDAAPNDVTVPNGSAH